MLNEAPYHLVETEAGEQRWRDRRSLFVPPSERFDPKRAEVVVLSETDAKRFVCHHHYSGSFPAARFRTGVMFKDRLGAEILAGVAVFAVPIQPASIRKYLGTEPALGVELSRLVLLPQLLFNAETWFLARSFKLLRARLGEVAGVISYCDPVPRYDMAGVEVKRGHCGTIYRAFNGAYHGQSGSRTLILSGDGRVVSERTLSKLRLGEVGAGYAYQQLLSLGAPARRPLEPDGAYVIRALAEGPFRRMKHPGNHVFSWRFR